MLEDIDSSSIINNVANSASNNRLVNFSKLLRDNKELMFCIFITLIIQLFITYLTAKVDQHHQLLEKSSVIVSILIFVVSIILVYLMIIPSIPFYVKQILFAIFSILTGLILSQVIHHTNDEHVIDIAALATFINFIIMLLIGFAIVYMGYDMGWMGIYLTIAIFVIIAISLINILTKKSKLLNKIIAIVTIVLFSIWILYDTNTILLKMTKLDKDTSCVIGALNYYLDIINIFTSYIDAMN